MKKVYAASAALAFITVLSSSVNVSAADWSKATYADDDPDTGLVVSYDENGVTVEEVIDSDITKVMIHLSDVLADPADLSRIYQGSWKVTYTGLSTFTGSDVGWLGGGCYAASCNSAGYSLVPDQYKADESPIWNDTQTVEDSFKWLLPSSVPTSADESVFVFMDWSGLPLKSKGVTITYHDLVLMDKEGNVIPQKTTASEEEPAEEPAEEEAPVEEAPAEEIAADEADAEASIPAATSTTSNASTGNCPAAAAAAVMAIAGAAALVSRRK